MMIDPHTMMELSKIRVNEYLEQAEKDRMFQALAVSDSGILSSLRAKVAGWIQHALRSARPEASRVVTGEHKRSTAEIPSV
jgi:hypothetical protein